MAPSLRARVVAAVAPLDRRSRYVRDARTMRARLAGPPLVSAGPPAWLRRRVRVARGEVAGVPCVRLSPRGSARRGGSPDAVYLHGGAYVGPISVWHWRFLAALVRASGATVDVPLYPLAPGTTARALVPTTAAVQLALRGRVLMGDSAGGGLALAVAQALRDAGDAQPEALVLLSPWVDVTMATPEIAAQAPRDPLLRADALALAGRAYAGAGDPADAAASPVNGDLAGLPPATILIGTRDLFLPDVRRLRDRLRDAGTPVTYVEEPEMLHDWMLLPTPEAARTTARLAADLHISTT